MCSRTSIEVITSNFCFDSYLLISSVINFCFGENNFANPVALEDVSIPVRETPVFCNSCMNLPSPHPKSKRFFGLISLKIFL